MLGVVGIVALLTVLGLSLIITRLATVALMATGLSYEAARFQARSAFTGTGFTTREAETVVDHPVRRRIVMWLMVVRSAGLMTIVISLILSFAGGGPEAARLIRLVWLTGGVVVLGIVSKSKLVDRCLSRAIGWALKKWTDLDVRDYANLLKLSGEYTITELQVEEGDWLVGKQLSACRLADEGVTVLGIYRNDGTYLGAPRGGTQIYAGDVLLLYGRAKVVRELDQRRADISGDVAHQKAIGEQRRHMHQQDLQEEQHERKRELHKEMEDKRNPPERRNERPSEQREQH